MCAVRFHPLPLSLPYLRLSPPSPFPHSFPEISVPCPDLRCFLLSHSSPGGRRSLRAGRWASTRYVRRSVCHPEITHPPLSLSTSLLQTDKVNPFDFSGMWPRTDLNIVRSSAVRYTSKASVR